MAAAVATAAAVAAMAVAVAADAVVAAVAAATVAVQATVVAAATVTAVAMAAVAVVVVAVEVAVATIATAVVATAAVAAATVVVVVAAAGVAAARPQTSMPVLAAWVLAGDLAATVNCPVVAYKSLSPNPMTKAQATGEAMRLAAETVAAIAVVEASGVVAAATETTWVEDMMVVEVAEAATRKCTVRTSHRDLEANHPSRPSPVTLPQSMSATSTWLQIETLSRAHSSPKIWMSAR